MISRSATPVHQGENAHPLRFGAMERVIVVGGGLAGVRSVEELRAHGLAEENKFSEKGEAALRDKYLGDNKSLPPRGLR